MIQVELPLDYSNIESDIYYYLWFIENYVSDMCIIYYTNPTYFSDVEIEWDETISTAFELVHSVGYDDALIIHYVNLHNVRKHDLLKGKYEYLDTKRGEKNYAKKNCWGLRRMWKRRC